MQTLTSTLFWIGLFQCPLLFCLFQWATRDAGQFDVEPLKFLGGVLGGSAILALPLWALGEIPVRADFGPGARAWFFGLMAGGVVAGLVRWIVHARQPHEPEPSAAPGRCPYCGRFPGFAKVIFLPPIRAFECVHCHKRVVVDPARASIGIALVFIPLAIYIIGWGPPEAIPRWTAIVLPLLAAAPYPFIVKIVPAEDGI